MKYLKIKNKGLLDHKLLMLIGGTTKDHNENLIGEFGTGLKYSLSWLLRNNIHFKIFVGTKQVQVDTTKHEIRGSSFEVINVDGQPTSVTTKLGSKDFKGWHVVRELYSNAIDEGGCEITITDTAEPEDENSTIFFIQMAGDIKNTYDNWDIYFLNNVKPLQVGSNFAVYPPSDRFRIYKRGMLIYEGKEDEKSVFSYDLYDAEINELREYRKTPNFDITWDIIPHLKPKLIETFIGNIKDKTEENWHFYKTLGSQWSTTIGNCKVISYDNYKKFKHRGIEIPENVIQVPEGLYEKLSEDFEHISALRTSRSIGSFIESYDDELLDKIRKEIPKLEYCGFKVPHDLNFITGEFGDKNVLAQIDSEKREIYVSLNMAHLGSDEIAAMIVEEVEHYNTGFNDHTREFQTHFIRKYVNLLYQKLKQH